MNFIKVTKVADFQTILKSDLYISQDIAQEEKEIFENTWWMSFLDIRSAKISQSDMLGFINTLIALRERQVHDKSVLGPITFYMWVDEMASQLRFSFISRSGCGLPFVCKVQHIGSPKEIVDLFFNITMEQSDVSEEGENVIEEDFCLKVFSKCLM